MAIPPLGCRRNELFLAMTMTSECLTNLNSARTVTLHEPVGHGHLRWAMGLMAARNTVLIGSGFEMRVMGDTFAGLGPWSSELLGLR